MPSNNLARLGGYQPKDHYGPGVSSLPKVQRASEAGFALSKPGRGKRSKSGRNSIRSGQALVELALIMTTLMFLAGGALDLGRAWYSSISVASAAREGALEAAVDPGSFQPGQPCDPELNRIMCRVIGAVAGANVTISPNDVSVICNPSPCPIRPTWGDTVTIRVSSHFGLITPFLSFFAGSDLTISASATSQLVIAP